MNFFFFLGGKKQGLDAVARRPAVGWARGAGAGRGRHASGGADGDGGASRGAGDPAGAVAGGGD